MITTRCNMTCDHCCFSCTSEGEDMSYEIFKKGIDTLGDDYIGIGGGEPTLHPDFWKFIGYALGHTDHVWMATNGSQTEIALVLANLAHKDVLGVDLSQDDYHDDIDPKVIDAFRNLDGASIRSVTDIQPVGRALEHMFYTTEKGCACDDMVVLPNGKIKWCGCEKAPIIGDVWDGIKDEYSYDYSHECYFHRE
jgi:hypothetical protein